MQAKFIPERNSRWKLPKINDENYKAAELGFKLVREDKNI